MICNHDEAIYCIFLLNTADIYLILINKRMQILG